MNISIGNLGEAGINPFDSCQGTSPDNIYNYASLAHSLPEKSALVDMQTIDEMDWFGILADAWDGISAHVGA